MGGSGPLLKPSHAGTRRDWWEVDSLGFVFTGRLSDVLATIAHYMVTLTDHAGRELFTAPLRVFETKSSLVISSQSPEEEGQRVIGILYIFDPPITSPSHPVAHLKSIEADTPILTDSLRIDAVLVATRVFQSE